MDANIRGLSIIDGEPEPPKDFLLMQNYPNPFNQGTFFELDLEEQSNISLEIFNTRGQIIRTIYEGVKSAGSHRFYWDGFDENGRALSTGVYFYKFSATRKNDKAFISTKKMLMLR